MRVVVSDAAAGFIEQQGGRVYVWLVGLMINLNASVCIEAAASEVRASAAYRTESRMAWINAMVAGGSGGSP
jgi:hypothetical protein